MMFGKLGKDKIAAALGTFTKAIDELKDGIKCTEVENEQIEKDLEVKRTAFKILEAEMGAKTCENNDSIAQASGVVTNIENLLKVEGK